MSASTSWHRTAHRRILGHSVQVLPARAHAEQSGIDSFFTALGKPQFSKGLIVSTTDNWGKNACDALNQTKTVARIGISDLEQSPIDWSKFDIRKPGQLKRTKKNVIRPHQTTALKDVINGLKEADRGKLIMACGQARRSQP